MSTQEIFVQHFVKLFQHYREALSPDTSVPAASWDALPVDERQRLVAAARLAVMELETNSTSEGNCRRYFAKPGEAEWGC
jgi:hypothetical protein